MTNRLRETRRAQSRIRMSIYVSVSVLSAYMEFLNLVRSTYSLARIGRKARFPTSRHRKYTTKKTSFVRKPEKNHSWYAMISETSRVFSCQITPVGLIEFCQLEGLPFKRNANYSFRPVCVLSLFILLHAVR